MRGALTAGVLAALVLVGTALAGTFSNASPIAIVDSATPPTVASSYPSQIVVSGEPTPNDMNVILTGFSHTFGDDVDILLVGPQGQSVILMSDAIGDVASNLTLTFDDQAANFLPDEDPAASGSYKPTNFGPSSPDACPSEPSTDTWPSAPAGPYGSVLSVFNGVNPNGTWRLFIVDDCAGDAGSISGGWSLTFISPTVVELASFSARTQKKGVLVRWRSASENGLLGFNVYRARGKTLTKLNHSLIRARGGVTGRTYSYLDRSARRGRTYTFRLQSVSTAGKRAWIARTSVRP
jgi:subtilisin-like proprotein convertase family protein